MNLKKTTHTEHGELILLANMVSFYQQLKVFQECGIGLKDFLLDKPLWIFVGNSVTSKRSGNNTFDKNRLHDDTLSDLQFTVSFFNKFLNNKNMFSKRIGDILEGKTALGNDDSNTVSNMFGYLKKQRTSPERIYNGILKHVFNSTNSGSITLCNISSSEGEVGLRVTSSEKYFALVYVNNVASFKKGLSSLDFQEDKFSDSLFGAINHESSPINILIGAKKFVEGWDSFRVSAMGLLNTGKSKGSQIIQLFGRGVRIRGYGNSMKRSSALINERILNTSPPNLSYLETLSIFGIKADYVDVFRTQLEEEGVYEEEVMSLRISKTADIPKKRLRTVKLTTETEFSRCVILENFDTDDVIEIDYRSKVQIYESDQKGIETPLNKTSEILLHEYLDLLDWDRIYFELYDFKQFRKFYNLHFDKKTIKEIMDGAKYKIHVDAELDIAHVGSEFLERLVLQILKKTCSRFLQCSQKEMAV